MSTEAAQTPAPNPIFITPMDVRWQDLDAYNHVNNANYLVYLQEARLKWLMNLPDPWYSPEAAPVMAVSYTHLTLPTKLL